MRLSVVILYLKRACHIFQLIWHLFRSVLLYRRRGASGKPERRDGGIKISLDST